MKNKLIAFNYFGGKYQWLEQLYKYFPNHTHFGDVFGGSFSVTLNKEPSKLDTANDLDGDVINFFMMLRDHGPELIHQLELTPVSRKEYDSCFPINDSGISDLERARRFFVRCRQSFQGSGIKQYTGFNACIESSEKGMSKNVAKYLSAVDKLPQVIGKLKSIQIENLDYSSFIKKYDRPGMFFYVDPPYELRTRNYKKWYSQEFEDKDHHELAELLHSIEGKAMVSGNDSEMYRSLYSDWNMVKLPAKRHSLKGAKLQEEVIWMNYQESSKPINSGLFKTL